MKKFLYLILIALTTTSFSSCSKDDDTKPGLEGSWYIYKESVVIDGETVHEEIQEDCDAESHFQILANNEVIYRNFINCNGYTTMRGTYDSSANQIVLEHEGEKYVFEAEYNNGDLLLSITDKVISNEEEINETTIYHCRKGEPMLE